MAAMFPAIYDAIGRNPHKEIQIKRAAEIVASSDENRWDSFTARPLDPAGPVSCMLYLTDPLFAQATRVLRKQMLREQVITLQERTETELKGRRWPRKKIHDLLGQQCAVHLPERSAVLDDALTELWGCQLLLLDRTRKRVEFMPADPRCWRSDKPIYVAEIDYRWILDPVETMSLLPWLTAKEEEGWTIAWPTAEGKLDDIKAAVLERNLTAHRSPGSDMGAKIKKEDWASTLGRVQSLEALREFQLSAM